MAVSDVLVFLENRRGAVKRASLEALSEGRRQARAGGGRLGAVVLGTGAARIADSLEGAAVVYRSEDPVYDALAIEAYAHAVGAAIQDFQPGLFLLAATPVGREVAPVAAHRLKTAVAADVIALTDQKSQVEVRRPIYAGKAIAVYRARKPAVASLRPNTFALEPGGDGGPPEGRDLPVPPASAWKARVVETRPAPGAERIELTEADIIVSGGRGLKGPEHFVLVEELARTLGAAVGASRAVCDAGWRPHSDQVGQTGKTVCPKLYVACGISGAIQHLAGMSSSKCIVAINKDRNAPIFQVADYGIVGDVFEVLPVLTEKLKGLVQA